MFRWMIYEFRPDGTQLMHTEETRISLCAINAGWDRGWAFLSEKAARLALAWLSVVYCIQDNQCRDIAKLERVYNNAFDTRGFCAWSARFGMCKYSIRAICNFDKGYYDPIEPNTISFPSLKEGLKNAIEKVY